MKLNRISDDELPDEARRLIREMVESNRDDAAMWTELKAGRALEAARVREAQVRALDVAITVAVFACVAGVALVAWLVTR